jgi:hypothetical protein
MAVDIEARLKPLKRQSLSETSETSSETSETSSETSHVTTM